MKRSCFPFETVVDEKRAAFMADPNSVSPNWRSFFENTQHRAQARPLLDEHNIRSLIQAFRKHGHLACHLDPLEMAQHNHPAPLNIGYHGFSEHDGYRFAYLPEWAEEGPKTFNVLHQELCATYCNKLGIELGCNDDSVARTWLIDQIENPAPTLTPSQQIGILQNLTDTETFEQFLQKYYPSTQRYSLEGTESLIPGIVALLTSAAHNGLKEAVFGMAHRGRLNFLAQILQKPFVSILSEFQGHSPYPESVHGSGDIKYHLGASVNRTFDGHDLHLTLNANPSHLECVNPVVMGRVRAKQQQRAGSSHTTPDALQQVCAILIHGDAALSGQGIVSETLMLSQLNGYRTGGTIHIVINNQIGFTTTPNNARSGLYCTDVMRTIHAPVLHVNADDVEAVCRTFSLAAAFRQKFARDICIDLVGYRRHGHNETDDPSFTQPRIARAIANKPSVRNLYAHQLIETGVIEKLASDTMTSALETRLTKEQRAAEVFAPQKADWLDQNWHHIMPASGDERSGSTGIDRQVLKELAEKLTTLPTPFNLHPKLGVWLDKRKAMASTGEGIDWPMAEALAFATLAREKTPIRLSGQDCQRGTFAQRHAFYVDQETEETYCPLANLSPEQASVDILNSPLSEYAVLGFEYGFSQVNPDALTLWEAQFGDFANNAQVIIDQFIASAESKWLRMSGLTLLLPHGHEGQGADHSDARLERFLSLSGADNWQVANCTTPANYFHILRRQIKRSFRKPLVLMTPKSLLRHPACVSSFADMELGRKFHRVIGETSKSLVEDRLMRRVVICSGKVYYDLLAMRDAKAVQDAAILRIEELYPFPDKPLEAELIRYPRAAVIWCQEEPQNMGAWSFVAPKIENVLTRLRSQNQRPMYIGRKDAAESACALVKQHNKEQTELVMKALTGF